MKSLGDTKLVSVRLYTEDVDALKGMYPTVGYNRVIRELVRAHVRRRLHADSEFERSLLEEPDGADA